MRIFYISFLIFISSALSQTGREPHEDKKTEKVINIQYTNNTPIIDGTINEAIWELADPIYDFIQDDGSHQCYFNLSKISIQYLKPMNNKKNGMITINYYISVD